MHFNYDVVMIPLQLIIVFFTIYYFVVSWFGLFGKMRETKQFPEKSTFALIVCAHNEQQVIAKLVENLKQLNYSDKLYDIFVVADNCVDKTAEAARNAGAIVYERFSETGKGKGFAMEWMFHRLFGPSGFPEDHEQPPVQRRASDPGLYGFQKSRRYLGVRHVLHFLLDRKPHLASGQI